jgi:CheY-like chemotaxis protein
MATRMRRFNWRSYELGLPHSWPRELRTAIMICLGSRAPMHVWWGRSQALFYNDACIDFLAPQSHPSALARSGRDAWSVIWDRIGPAVESVFRSGVATSIPDLAMTNVRGRSGEVYLTFSFAPLVNDSGRIDGVFGTCIETVEPLIGNASEPEPIEVTGVRKRVLLVEDNHDTAIALQRALEKLGYEVALAHDGPVALALARSFDPEVALVDIGLPVMDGWELVRRLRERREVRCIAVTARDEADDIRRSEAAGFVDHLAKPVDLMRLQSVIEGGAPL